MLRGTMRTLSLTALRQFLRREDDLKLAYSTGIFEDIEKKISEYVQSIENLPSIPDYNYEGDQLTDRELVAISNLFSNYNWMEKLPENLGFEVSDISLETGRETVIVILQRLLARWRYRTRVPRETQIEILIRASYYSFTKKSYRFIRRFLKELKKIIRK
ncbi:hypothetical protein HZS_6960 [Henneguya salminicola]|nr:hypothetical protein HZS_6960 [Henneguya salminicola]